MRDDDDGDAERLVDLAQQLQDRARRVGVERTGRLVAEQIPGIGRQGSCDGHALLLAAGELRGVACSLVGKADDPQQLLRPLLRFRLRRAGDLQREADVAQDRPLLEQVEALEDHADLPPDLQQLLLAEGHDVLPVHQHLARGRPLKQVDAAHQRRFARAGQADDTENFAVCDREIHILQRFYAAGGRGIDFAEMFQLDHG